MSSIEAKAEIKMDGGHIGWRWLCLSCGKQGNGLHRSSGDAVKAGQPHAQGHKAVGGQ